MTRICLVLSSPSAGEMLATLQRCRKWAGMVEVRADALHARGIGELEKLKPLLQDATLPVLWTVRWKGETGAFGGDEAERRRWLDFGDKHGAQWIDVEAFSPLGAEYRPNKAKLVHSTHNFKETPADLADTLRRMAQGPADILKMACAAHKTADLRRVLELYHLDLGRPLIAIAMGEWGECSRILPAVMGLPWTYAAADAAGGTAPGQFNAQELSELYRVQDITADTPTYVVIGDPVSHSLSPRLHNTHYRRRGINAVYGRIHVDDMQEFDKIADILKLRGASVTVPHKEALMRDARDTTLVRIGSANTLRRRPEGGWDIANTDIAAAMAALREKLTGSRSVHALVLGAGGVSRALAAGMLDLGWRVTICNRTDAKAAALAEALGCVSLPWSGRTVDGFDAIVNGTTLGMSPNVESTPLEITGRHPNLVVFDTVYTPENTLLLRQARAAGAVAISGREMFYRQAALQHQFWFGGDPPYTEMKEILTGFNQPG